MNNDPQPPLDDKVPAPDSEWPDEEADEGSPTSAPPRKRFLAALIERVGDGIIRRIRRRRILEDQGARGLYFRIARRYVTRKLRPYFAWLAPPFRLFYRVFLRPIELFHKRMPVPALRALYFTLFLAVFAGAGAYFWQHRPQTDPDSLRHPELNREAQITKLSKRISALISEGKLDAAEKEIEKLRAAAPDHQSLFTMAGILKAERKDYVGAREEYTRAVEAAPESYNAQFNLAELDFMVGRYKEAELRFASMALRRPDDEFITFRLFLCALFLEDRTHQEAYLQKLSPTGKTPAWFYASAARLYLEQKRVEARRLLDRAAAFYPDNTGFFDATFNKLGFR
jgi:tetratricopeptide (TPR) repeat protein